MSIRLALRLAALAVVLTLAPCYGQSSDGLRSLSAVDLSGIRAAYEDGLHQVTADDQGFGARNVAQRYRARFDGRGFTVDPDDGDWEFGLELVAFGRAERVEVFTEPLGTASSGRGVQYRWSEDLTEWFTNHDRGLEHGFTVERAPAGREELVLRLDAHGDLSATISADGRTAVFSDDDGQQRIRYAGLTVVDALDRPLGARLTATASGLTISVDDTDAHYPVHIDPVVQQAYVKASNTESFDEFGGSIAVDGDTVVVGAYEEDGGSTGIGGDQSNNGASSSGAVYVFVRSGSTWTQQAYIKASNTGANDEFGDAVAISGDTLVVGAPWESSSAAGVGGDETNDDSLASGAAYVFVRSGTTWSQQAYLKASDPGPFDRFASAVAVAGNTLVIGAENESSNATGIDGNETDNSAFFAGAAYVFVRSGTTWSQQAYLKASNTDLGDQFGDEVGVAGDTVVVSAPGEESSAAGIGGDQTNNAASASGAVYVFERIGTTWSQQAYVKASNADPGDAFGEGLSISGDTVIVGAPWESSAATGVGGDQSDNTSLGSGAAYVFRRTGSTWSQEAYLKPSDSTVGAKAFGRSVALAGDVAIVGAPLESSNASGVYGDPTDTSLQFSGAAYVFTRTGAAWAQGAYLKASNPDFDDGFGYAVAVSGDTALASAPSEESAATGIDGDQTDDSAGFSGSVYLFDLEPDWCLVNGCHGNTASYLVPAVPAQIGTAVPVQLLGSVVNNGVVATYYGAKGVDAIGCGLLLAPNEELLLAITPFPVLLGLAPMTAGVAALTLPISADPGIVGFQVTLQSVAIDTTTFASEFSNGLEFEIRP